MTVNPLNFILNYFRPSLHVEHFTDVNLRLLKQNGVKLFISDLDNTLISPYKKIPTPDVKIFIQKVQELDMKFVIVSNNTKNKVNFFCKQVNVDGKYGNSKKPFLGTVKKVLKDFNVSKREAVFMGNQVLTDIWVANRLHIDSILVNPIIRVLKGNKKFLRSVLENKIYANLEKNNLLIRDNYSVIEKFEQEDILL